MEMMLACMSVICGGVCERHPKICIAFLESGSEWIARGSTGWTGISTIRSFNDSGLKTRPSDLFRRNCWISFEPVERSQKVLAEYIGPHKSYGRLTTRTATASSPARRRSSRTAWRARPPMFSTKFWPAALSAFTG